MALLVHVFLLRLSNQPSVRSESNSIELHPRQVAAGSNHYPVTLLLLAQAAAPLGLKLDTNAVLAQMSNTRLIQA